MKVFHKLEKHRNCKVSNQVVPNVRLYSRVEVKPPLTHDAIPTLTRRRTSNFERMKVV